MKQKLYLPSLNISSLSELVKIPRKFSIGFLVDPDGLVVGRAVVAPPFPPPLHLYIVLIF